MTIILILREIMMILPNSFKVYNFRPNYARKMQILKQKQKQIKTGTSTQTRANPRSTSQRKVVLSIKPIKQLKWFPAVGQ